ncbi:hypothetical protein RN001_005551 [Aquatica leii]|uniref:DUF4806 domain-containing protein n=1 Tax=Aquatica leii TaxID=1421715 RepID=A0AAN7Q1G0_9COLE|nr:hypothetical protein RN001_005551 [Aquatica leii]
MRIQKLTYRNCKCRNTFQELIVVAPSGVIAYVSYMCNSGVLEVGDLIWADKRDLIQRVTALELHKPSISTNSNFNYSLPCQNLHDLENLEKYITKDQYTLFCEYIRNIEGNGGKDFVVRFMKTLLSNATGELCSWTGAKNNFKLMNLKIMKAAYETINSGNMQVTLKEFEMFIKEWLRHCKQRRMKEDLK